MHPWVVRRPMDQGVFVPWIWYSPFDRRMRYRPNGLSGPGGTTARGSSIVRWMDRGTTQVGFSSLDVTVNGPTGLGASSVPMPTGQVRKCTVSPARTCEGNM